jgi:hypothetical protein
LRRSAKCAEEKSAVPSPKLILPLAKAILRDSRLRRTAMFYLTLAALTTLFLGTTVLDEFLRQRVFLFLIWWGGCGWLVITVALLAVFDILIIRAAARRERRDLARKILERDHVHEDPR